MEYFSINKFKNPPKSARPLARWWWTGLDVTAEELCREIAEMDEKAFYGCEIQTLLSSMDKDFKAKDPERYYREHRYGTDYYFTMVAKVLEECKIRGMVVDLTVGSCWPIGGTDVLPDEGLKTLIMSAVTVEGGGRRTVALPTASEAADAYFSTAKFNLPHFIPDYGDRSDLKASLRLLCVTAAKPINGPGAFKYKGVETALLDFNSATDLTSHVSGETLEWDFPEGLWQVFVTFTGPSYSIVNLNSKQHPERESYALDHFTSGLIEDYLDRNIGRGNWEQYYGNTLRSFFSDSFELDSQCYWTDSFLYEFKRRRGYDLTPYIEVIYVPDRDNRLILLDDLKPCFDFPDGIGKRIRYDYELTIAELFKENMLEALKKWGDEHNLKSRVQCYGVEMDNIKAFGNTHIPETEQLASNGNIDFMKLAGSAAILNDKPLVTAESLVWPDQDYKVTPIKMKVASDRLFISGVNQMIYHGWPYQNPDAKWPGSYPFHGSVGSFISRNDSMWPWLGDINTYIARGQQLMQSGQTKVDIALVNLNLKHEHHGPLEELGTGILDGIDRKSASHRGARPIRSEWAEMAEYSRCLGNFLMEHGYDYMHINEECLIKATLDEGTLLFGKARLKALILPKTDAISVTAAVKLRELMDKGFPVIFSDRVPSTVPGYKNYQKLSERIKSIFAGVEAVDFNGVPERICKAGILPGVRFGSPGLQHLHKTFKDMDLYFVRSRTADSRMVKLEFPIANKNVRVLNAWTGKVSSVPTNTVGGKTEITLPFVPFGSHFILLGDDEKLPRADEDSWLDVMTVSVSGTVIQRLAHGWKLTVTSIVPADEGKTVVLDNASEGDWVDMEPLKNVSGKGAYEKEFELAEKPEGRIVLDLGIVGDVAEVELNGSQLPAMIAYPYAADVTDLVKTGKNQLVIKITNTLRNGMIGSGAFRNAQRTYALSGIAGPIALKTI